MVRARVLRFVVRVPPQRPARATSCGTGSSTPTTSTSRTSTPITSTRRSWPSTCAATSRPAARLPDPRARAADAGARLHGIVLRTDGRGARARPRRPHDRDPRRDIDHRRPGRRLGAGRSATARHASSTRTTAGPTISTRSQPTDRSTCTGSSTRARSGTRWSTTSRPTRMRELLSTPRSRASSPGRCATSRRIGARAVVPSRRAAGVPRSASWHLNVVTGDELSIFPDQRAFLDPPRTAGHRGHPGDPRHRDRDRRAGRAGSRSIHPIPDDAVERDLHRQGGVPRRVRSRLGGMARPGEGQLGTHRPTTCSTDLKAWWEPLLAMAPTLRTAVGADCPAAHRRPRAVDRLPGRRGAPLRRRGPTASGSTSRGSWSRPSSPSARSTGATRCSCRAGSGPGGTARSTSTSTTSSSRCRSSACAAPRPRRCASSSRSTTTCRRRSSCDGYVFERFCPHRHADLSVFGEIEDGDAHVHAARLALRPRDRPLPHGRTAPSGFARRPLRTVGRRSRAVDRPAESASFAARRHGSRRPTSPSSNKETSRCAAEHLEPLPPPNSRPATISAIVGSRSSSRRSGVTPRRSRRRATIVVDALTTRPEELNGALARFGRELGGEGWLLTELTAWIGVAGVRRRHGRTAAAAVRGRRRGGAGLGRRVSLRAPGLRLHGQPDRAGDAARAAAAARPDLRPVRGARRRDRPGVLPGHHRHRLRGSTTARAGRRDGRHRRPGAADLRQRRDGRGQGRASAHPDQPHRGDATATSGICSRSCTCTRCSPAATSSAGSRSSHRASSSSTATSSTSPPDDVRPLAPGWCGAAPRRPGATCRVRPGTRQDVGPAARRAEPAMGDVDVHDELVGRGRDRSRRRRRTARRRCSASPRTRSGPGGRP